MRKYEMMKINGNALREALARRNISITNASEMLFKSVGYFSNILARESINKGDYTLFKFMLEQKSMGLSSEEIDAIEMTPKVEHEYKFGFAERTTEEGRKQVVCKIYEDGEEVASGFSNIRFNTKLEYASALAWATRCMWKQIEDEGSK